MRCRAVIRSGAESEYDGDTANKSVVWRQRLRVGWYKGTSSCRKVEEVVGPAKRAGPQFTRRALANRLMKSLTSTSRSPLFFIPRPFTQIFGFPATSVTMCGWTIPNVVESDTTFKTGCWRVISQEMAPMIGCRPKGWNIPFDLPQVLLHCVKPIAARLLILRSRLEQKKLRMRLIPSLDTKMLPHPAHAYMYTRCPRCVTICDFV